MSTVQQRRVSPKGGAPRYELTTEDGSVWDCDFWAYWYLNWGHWELREDAPSWARDTEPQERWHLMRPNGKHEKSFRQLGEAERYLATRTANGGRETTS